MNILVTGGAGFIGSVVSNRLSNDGHDVFVIDNLSTGNIENLLSEIELINADICSDEAEQIFKKQQFDVMLHFAAQTGVGSAEASPANDAKQNILGSINMFSLCQKYGVKKVFAVSSAAVYGMVETLPVNEQATPCPISFYGISKLTMEAYIKKFNFDWTVFRPANVWSENQPLRGETGVIGLFRDAMKNNQPVYIHGDGLQVRDFVHVEDVAEVFARSICSDKVAGEVFNVSTGVGVSIKRLFDFLCVEYGYKLAPIYESVREADIRASILDNSKLLNAIEFAPQSRFI